MPVFQAPGVFPAELLPAPAAPLRTGVPALLGLATSGPVGSPTLLELPSQFAERYGVSPAGGFLADAVEGFFANGGEACRIVRLDEGLDPVAAVEAALEAIADVDDLDLVCLPDASRLRRSGELPQLPPIPARVQALQRAVIDHCELVGTRIAILDSLPNVGTSAVLDQRRLLTSPNATLYYPWIRVRADDDPGAAFVPPSGHVAGVYAATDRRIGVHKAPANELVEGALDLELAIDDDVQASLNPVGVNCLRAFPGRGIRVWGARTLATETAWTYVSTRRLVLTAARWIEANLGGILFEPDDERLRGRLRRELTAYLTVLYRQGALVGATPEEAFYVRCDAATNTPSAPGRVVAEIGLAPGRPYEFVAVYVVQEAGGLSVTGPTRSS